MKWWCGRAVIVCVLAIAPSPALAQRAGVSGTVIDQSGGALPGVNVGLINLDQGLKRETVTDQHGSFTIPLLPPGRYSLTAQLTGFAPYEVKELVLNGGDELAFSLRLEVAKVGESVTVTAKPPRINTSPAVGTVVDRQFVENMPLNGRSLQSLITLTPGVVLVPSSGSGGQFSINGQRADANYVTVDGVSGNIANSASFAPGNAVGGTLPGFTTFGGTNNLVSIDALQEFKIETSSYAAEFGRMPGGQIAMVTRAGTNVFHGTVSEYVRNEAFDANDWFANRGGNPKAALRQNDFGGVLGGPLLLPGAYDGRGRTFFFASYEGLRLLTPQFALTNVPTLALRQTAPATLQPILNSWPLPNGKDLGNGFAEFSAAYSDESSLNAASVRIDQNFGGRFNMFGRYNDAPSWTHRRVSGNSLSQVSYLEYDTRTLTLGATIQLSPRVVTEVRANYSNNGGHTALRPDDFGGAAPVSRGLIIPEQYAPEGTSAQTTIFLDFPGRTQSASPRLDIDDARASQVQTNIVASTAVIRGRHQLKFGADYRRLAPVLEPRPWIFSPHFTTQADVLRGIANTANISSIGAKEIPVYTNLSLFGQDTWTSGRLTTNIGVRWELNPPPKDQTGHDPYTISGFKNLATLTIAPQGTPLWKTTYWNLAPRAGIAFIVSDVPGRETVVRSGIGLFYDTGGNQAAAGYFGYGFSGSKSLTNVPFPLDFISLTPASVNFSKPYGTVFGFDPNLQLPFTLEWNIAIERALGAAQALTVGYIGARGRKLLQQRALSLRTINPDFTTVNLITNDGESDYTALQVQYRHRLSRGLQALASYTWAHAIDTVSTDSVTNLLLRGNADFDIRHNFAVATTYEVPAPHIGAGVLRGWAVDLRASARSAAPFSITAGTFVDADGTVRNIRANLVPDVPIYLDDPNAPGGRRVNPTAFSIPVPGDNGNLGRNVLRGFAVWQVDLAVRRQLRLSSALSAQFRAEAFNLFNTPNFGAISSSLTAANFGQATNMFGRQLGGLNALYQIGGPRSIQFALKLQF